MEQIKININKFEFLQFQNYENLNKIKYLIYT